MLRSATWDAAENLLRLATLAGPEIAETFGSYPVPGQDSKRLALLAEQSGV